MWQMKKGSLFLAVNGIIAGLAGITPTSGYNAVLTAIICTLLIAIFVHPSIFSLKYKLRIEGALDVSSVHGALGLAEALFIGITGTSNVGRAEWCSMWRRW
ncbi:ammonium transporter [Trypanosoma grayi]|uniref:ammonium transporter n=1 Tax=Trypanosoma grayi TaxID=71804 RepID=UPI0004F47BC4|nr:ammonium transporter [Trypanosoma grayi]KEG09094.1 ammonium transporter [Trypanosoma grayi]